MSSEKFYGVCFGYTQKDIEQIIKEVTNRGDTRLMNDYNIVRVRKNTYCIENKWDEDDSQIIRGTPEKVVLDALSIECLGHESEFQSYNELVHYMVKFEKEDMEEYLRNEEEWEYY